MFDTVAPSPASARAFLSRYFVALGVSVALLAGAFVAIDWTRASILSESKPVPGLRTTPVSPGAPANFLIVGSDTRAFVEGEAATEAFGAHDTSARSDTIMVAHLDPKAHRAYVVSFPRDLWVDIPGHGNAKINAAFNSGPQTLIDTLEQDFGVPINHYLEVDFQTFRDAVNAIGHVNVFFPAPARDRFSGLDIPRAGCVPLDGDQALAYVRSRYYQELGADGRWSGDGMADIARIGRQQSFLRRLAGSAIAKAGSNPFAALDLSSAVMHNVRRDPALDDDELLSFVAAFVDIDPYDPNAVEMVTYPWKSGPDQGGQSVLYPDSGAAGSVLSRLRDTAGSTGSPPPEVAPSTVRVRVLNGSGANGAAREVMDGLRRAGFSGAGTGNADRVGSLEIRYTKGGADKARLVQSYFGGVGTLIEDPTVQDVDVLVILGPDPVVVAPPGAPGAAVTSAPAANRATTTPTGSAPVATKC